MARLPTTRIRVVVSQGQRNLSVNRETLHRRGFGKRVLRPERITEDIRLPSSSAEKEILQYGRKRFGSDIAGLSFKREQPGMRQSFAEYPGCILHEGKTCSTIHDECLCSDNGYPIGRDAGIFAQDRAVVIRQRWCYRLKLRPSR